MERFLVISHHTGEDCVKALKQVLAIGYLTHYEWGCKDGIHTGWAILEGDSKDEVLLSVPTFLRGKAEVVHLVKFDPRHVERMHEPKLEA